MKLKTVKSLLVAAFAAVGLSAFAEPLPIGESSVTWELMENNTVLTLGGTGAMPDFKSTTSTDRPWKDATTTITTVKIERGVTSIGNYAFHTCSKLTSVTIPSGVTNIGNYAFSYCSVLTSVTIPSGVTNIGNQAFYGCSGLTGALTIPSGVTNIGNAAFYKCSGLTSVTVLAANPPTLGGGALPSNVSVTYVPKASVEDYKTATNWSSFANQFVGLEPAGKEVYVQVADGNCAIVGAGKATALPNGFDRDSITSVTVDDGITEIGESFFKDCLFLNAVRVGKGVERIGDKAFWFCMSLEKIEIGNAAALDCLEKAVVYRAAFDSAGRPCVIPSISLPGYAEVLLGKRELTDEKWTELGPVGEKTMTEYGDYRFFKIELKAE